MPRWKRTEMARLFHKSRALQSGANLTTGAWCYYNNDPTKPRLYNWYAVMGMHDTEESTPNKEFAPEGWRVPSNAEWTTLRKPPYR